MNRKDFKASTKVNGSTFKAIISTDSVDRDGEVMVPQGMNSKDFENNPVLLWQHDPSQPVGRAIALKRNETSIEAEFEFAKRPDDYEGDWFPDYVRGLVAADILKAVSIGFMPMTGGERMATKGDVDRYGPEVRKVYSKWKLLEVSVVSVPANQDALITAVQKGLVTSTAVERFGAKFTMPISADRKDRLIERHKIVVTVPAVGAEDAKEIVRREFAKARGRFVV